MFAVKARYGEDALDDDDDDDDSTSSSEDEDAVVITKLVILFGDQFGSVHYVLSCSATQ